MGCQNCKDCGSDPPCDCEIGCPYRPSDDVVRVELVCDCGRTDGVFPVEEVFKDQFSNEEFYGFNPAK